MNHIVGGVLFALASASFSQPAGKAPDPAQLIGTWRGTSVCTDRVAAPACADERVVYEFTPGAKPGVVHWKADKIVNGERQSMGEMDLAYDSAEACWKAEYAGPRVTSVWRITVDGKHLTGTARLLPGNETIRKIDLRKDTAPDGQFAAAPFEPGELPLRWAPANAECAGVAPFTTHNYNSSFIILRQSGCTNFEKPFLYLVFGGSKAMLVDSGAKGADVSPVVFDLLRRHAEREHKPELPLIVIHSHGHSDHVAGDAVLRGHAGVRLVDGKVDALSAFFGISDWPHGAAQYDLGDRVVDIIPIPGHEVASIAVYDRRTGILLTGDTLYPGRLYVRDAAAFRESIDRLVAFTGIHPVAHALGAHIENTRAPFLDYPEGTVSQPDEHPLELGRAHLLELQSALRARPAALVRERFRDFTIWPVEAR